MSPMGILSTTQTDQLTVPDGEFSYRGTGRLEGCTALVTGGDSGIGAAVEKLPEFGQSTPLGRAGQPPEVAPAMVFLA